MLLRGPILERIERILATRTPARPLFAWTLALSAILLAGSCLALGPGINFSPENAAETIPWLAPSRDEPNARMLEVRSIDRRINRFWRAL